jgi:hypothetical protein
LGDHDLPAVTGGADPGSTVDPKPDVALASAQWFPGVQSHADAHRGITSPLLLENRPLRGDPRVYGIPGTSKNHKKCVSLSIYNLAAVVREGRVEQLVVRV